MTAAELQAELRSYIDAEKAALYPRFFKTEPGQYGEGDKFLGVTVPNTRKVAKLGKDLPLREVEKLLHSPWHEDRLLALIIMVNQFRKGDEATQKQIYDFYMANTQYVNNWDLVDTSAGHIVGGFLFGLELGYAVGYPRGYHVPEVLTDLASSNLLWERRIAMIATSYWINKGQSEPAIAIANLLINDEHDLMHKALGWMLREVGKRVDPDILRDFLDQHAATMPRTTLRYAIEHFSAQERKMWLAKRTATGV